MRFFLFLFAVSLALAAPAVQAQGQREMSKSEHTKWAAIGRVFIQPQDGDPARICTGTLVTPDTVLTAGHCVHTANGKRRLRPENVSFQAGLYDQKPIVIRTAGVLRPANGWVLPTDEESLRRDIALIKLTAPVPGITPIPIVGELGNGPFQVIGYRFDNRSRMTDYSPCHRTAPASIILLDCDAVEGTSGAPIMRRNGRGWAVGGVMTAVSQAFDAIGATYDPALFR